MRLALVVALAGAGCSKLECGPGTEEVDGVCTVFEVEADPVDIDDVLDALPACEPVEANSRIDLDAGCADGACASMTKAEVDVALASTGSCEASTFDPTSLYCDWAAGMWASFEDLDEDGVPDATSVAGTLFLEDPYDGSTTDGLGVGASLSCFLDALGTPNSIDFWDLGGKLEPASMSWFDLGLYVSDFFGTGAADTVAISGIRTSR